MRFLLSTIGSRGDVQPLVALASQLRACGQEVRLCVPPDFRDRIESLGFAVTPIGPELRKATAGSQAAPPAPPSPERRRQLAEATVAAQFETITAAAGGCDAIVGATALQIAAPSVAEIAGIAVFQTGAWILPDERPLPAEAETFLDAGEPPVYFGFGSMRAPQDLGRVMLEAARALGRRAIVSRGWADLSVGEHEPDCLVVGEVDVRALFARVAAVVHHGGAGTTTAAALAGAPQVVVPQMYDQHYWGARVERLGIGTAHALGAPGAPTADSLASALQSALRPEVAARARTIAGRVRRDGAEVAARQLMADPPG